MMSQKKAYKKLLEWRWEKRRRRRRKRMSQEKEKKKKEKKHLFKLQLQERAGEGEEKALTFAQGQSKGLLCPAAREEEKTVAGEQEMMQNRWEACLLPLLICMKLNGS
jgi:hypothetical protein